MRVLSFILIVFFPQALHAAAWPQAKGGGQVIDTLSLYSTDRYFGTDSTSDTFPQATFGKLENSVYAEYGWRDATTLGLKTNYQYNEMESPSIQSYGIGDTEFFVRQMLWKDGGHVFSVQPLIKLPSLWQGGSRLPVGTDGLDAELRLLHGYGFELWGLSSFVGSEVGYRAHTSDASNEWHVDESLGLWVTPSVMLLAQAFVTVSENTSSASFSTVNSSDYDLAKGQFSVVAEFTDTLSVQAGAYQHAYGHNTGAGGGIFLSLWVDF